jgi:hypothetical protein
MLDHRNPCHPDYCPEDDGLHQPKRVNFPVLELKKISDSNDSSDSLPTRYNMDQLVAYIGRQLCAPTWNVELTKQQILDCILDSMRKFSNYRPVLQYGAIPMVAGQKQYLTDMDIGQGIASISFVENRLGVLNLDFGNPFTTMSIMTTGLGLDGMGDYDSYLRWQKTWQRVTSTMPDWTYDEVRRCLWIHNPIARYRAAVLIYRNWDKTENLPAFGLDWVKDYSLAKSSKLLGDVFMKFSGSLPGPAQNMQLDSGRRDKAEATMKELENTLKGAQETTPLSID